MTSHEAWWATALGRGGPTHWGDHPLVVQGQCAAGQPYALGARLVPPADALCLELAWNEHSSASRVFEGRTPPRRRATIDFVVRCRGPAETCLYSIVEHDVARIVFRLGRGVTVEVEPQLDLHEVEWDAKAYVVSAPVRALPGRAELLDAAGRRIARRRYLRRRSPCRCAGEEAVGTYA
jgi:hypothetical protein